MSNNELNNDEIVTDPQMNKFSHSMYSIRTERTIYSDDDEEFSIMSEGNDDNFSASDDNTGVSEETDSE